MARNSKSPTDQGIATEQEAEYDVRFDENGNMWHIYPDGRRQMVNENTGEVVAEVMPHVSSFNKEDLSRITSIEDASILAREQFGNVITADQAEGLGDGFRLAKEDDKRTLVGLRMLLLEWSFYAGDFGKDFVTIRIIDANNRKWIVNDGSTGICDELHAFTEKTGRTGGLMLAKGLRVSDYHVDKETGRVLSKPEYRKAVAEGRETIPGTTFYLDTSAA